MLTTRRRLVTGLLGVPLIGSLVQRLHATSPARRSSFDYDRLHERLYQIYPYGWASTPDAGGPLFTVPDLGNFQVHFRGFFLPRGASGYVGAWEAWPAPPFLPDDGALGHRFVSMCPYEEGCTCEYLVGEPSPLPRGGLDIEQMYATDPDGYIAEVCGHLNESLGALIQLLYSKPTLLTVAERREIYRAQ